MWNLNENENKAPWEINLEQGNDNNFEESDCHDAMNDQIENLILLNPVTEKRIVQVYTFVGHTRYDNFNAFAIENEIGEEDIVEIIDSSSNNILRLFYLV